MQKRDGVAFREIFETCGDYCIRVLMSRTNCPYEDAEDILMDALLVFRDKVLEGKIRELSSLKSYLSTTCWNMWMARSRAQQRWWKAQDELSRAYYLVRETDPMAEKEARAEEEASYTRKVKISEEALASLGEKCRKVIRYFYIDRLSMEEIANKMGWASANVAKTNKSRCYKKWIASVKEQMATKDG